MTEKFMDDFIGKECSILSYGDIIGTTGKIISVEDNWVKVQMKKQIQIINIDMISKITLNTQKNQK